METMSVEDPSVTSEELAHNDLVLRSSELTSEDGVNIHQSMASEDHRAIASDHRVHDDMDVNQTVMSKPSHGLVVTSDNRVMAGQTVMSDMECGGRVASEASADQATTSDADGHRLVTSCVAGGPDVTPEEQHCHTSTTSDADGHRLVTSCVAGGPDVMPEEQHCHTLTTSDASRVPAVTSAGDGDLATRPRAVGDRPAASQTEAGDVMASTVDRSLVMTSQTEADDVMASAVDRGLMVTSRTEADDVMASTVDRGLVVTSQTEADDVMASTVDRGLVVTSQTEADGVMASTVDRGLVVTSQTEADDVMASTVDRSLVVTSQTEADDVMASAVDRGLVVTSEERPTEPDDIWTPLQYGHHPRLITTLTTPFNSDNFTKGCKWSPDGTCLLVCSEDSRLRLLNLPQQLYGATVAPPEPLPEPNVVLHSYEGELIFDYTWFPRMRSDIPATCCYVSSSRAHPIHMFDAFDGALRCSYRAYNNVDEVAAAYSVAFDPAGERLYAGFDGSLALFDVGRPGRQLETRKLKDKKSLAAQPGIVSCIGFSAASPDIYAVGSYLRSIGLYSSADGAALCVMQGQTGGVTHLQFSPDGTRLYSGGRKDPEILCWDLRNLGRILYSVQRTVVTNQRMYFDCDVTGRHLFSGDSEGCVQVWDTQASPSDFGDTLVLPSIRKFTAHRECCNGVSVHPWLPVLATSSGQRHLRTIVDSSDDDEDERYAGLSDKRLLENTVKLWWLGS